MGSRQGLSFVPTERQECNAFFKWASYHPVVGEHLIHIPNEGLRSPVAGRSLKQVGLAKGIPDYFIAVRNERYGGLFIEMKRSKRYRISKYQDAWIKKLLDAGYYATYAFGWVEAVDITLNYLGNKL